MCACIDGQEEVLLRDICKTNIRRLVIWGLRCRVCVYMGSRRCRCKMHNICTIFARYLRDICKIYVRRVVRV